MGSSSSFFETLRLRYSYTRFRWLAIAVAGMTIMTFSAQELWAENAQGLCYTVDLEIFYLYAAFFVSIILLTNFMDYRRICERTTVVVCCTFISLIVDLGFLFVSEFFMLLTINQTGTELIRTVACIFLVVLPWSLGEITLSSLTIEYLRKRAERLQREAEELRKEAERLDKERREKEKSLRELKRKEEEFKRVFKK